MIFNPAKMDAWRNAPDSLACDLADDLRDVAVTQHISNHWHCLALELLWTAEGLCRSSKASLSRYTSVGFPAALLHTYAGIGT